MEKLNARRKALFVFLVLSLHPLPGTLAGPHDYGEALSKSFLFYEAQRSGFLPENQRVTWRGHSGLTDGKLNGVDLVGGYYDAGDNVKFGLPMAFTITMMSWSVVEYGKQMAVAGELGNAMDAVKWGTDYLIKAHPQPHVLYGEVGDGNSDHYCWQRPEDMTTSRLAYKIDESKPGSDLAGETAAAMAAASIVFRDSNPGYSSDLLNHARQLFEFADGFRGVYDRSITVAQNYYSSWSGYDDELLWAAAWLYQATQDPAYLTYLAINSDSESSMGQFSWDVKYPGVQVLVSKFLMQGKAGAHESIFQKYKQKAEAFICSQVGKGLQNVRKTPAGLIFVQRWNNMQFVTGASFLLTVYSDYLSSSKSGIHCPLGFVNGVELLDFAKSQVDYILGDNPRSTSYMVGYGRSYPQQVHHRASSIVSIKADPSFVTCRGGYSTWFSRRGRDPNLLHGAIVGGPGAHDDFDEARENFRQTEPTLYNSAPLIGVLARLSSGHGGYNRILPVMLDHPATGSSSPVVIKQVAASSWEAKGRTYHRYSAWVSNRSPKPLKSLQLVISKLYGPLWGLSRNGGSSYGLPEWVDSVPAGESFEFIYVHASPPADVTVLKYTLG